MSAAAQPGQAAVALGVAGGESRQGALREAQQEVFSAGVRPRDLPQPVEYGQADETGLIAGLAAQ
jgi:hypothetical protein